MVGVAKVLNSFSSDGSKRSIAWIRPEEPNLLDVLERLAAVGEAAGDVVDEVAVELDKLLADLRVAGAVELAEQAAHLGTLGGVRRLGDRSLAGRHAVAAPRRWGHEALYLVSRTRRFPVRSSTR